MPRQLLARTQRLRVMGDIEQVALQHGVALCYNLTKI